MNSSRKGIVRQVKILLKKITLNICDNKYERSFRFCSLQMALAEMRAFVINETLACDVCTLYFMGQLNANLACDR